jgi:enamine deaminase RidA (YjgF/YER057c/UK114 family)
LQVTSLPAARTIEAHGCEVVLRRVAGPAATELHLHARPPAVTNDPRRQSEAIYRAIDAALRAEGGTFDAVVLETIFLRDLRGSLDPVRAARRAVIVASGAQPDRAATTEIEQPPLDGHSSVEVMLHAVLPHASPARMQTVTAPRNCDCAECNRAHGLVFHLANEARFQAGGLCGAGSNAYEESLDMFGHAERLLHQAGMNFGDVVRTWIYLRYMARDYPALNRARREFFTARGIQPFPASTGIYGAPPSQVHDLCLGVYAVKAGRTVARTVMSSSTLNEAADYGADFTRGLKVMEANRIALHVSGTASVDEQGRTANEGNFDAQAERMLVNIAALLERQGAGFGNVVSAITYLKDRADAGRLRAKLRDAGFAGFPHALVVAEVCRPALLCETEALAVLPAV